MPILSFLCRAGFSSSADCFYNNVILAQLFPIGEVKEFPF